MTLLTERDSHPFIIDNNIFDDVINIISGTHPKIPIPKNFSLDSLHNLYKVISENFNDLTEAYFIWKRIVSWQLCITFRYFDHNEIIITEFDPLLTGGINEEEDRLIEKVMSELSFDYRWIFSQGHNIQNNLNTIKIFTQDDQILKEFLVFFPDYPIIKEFEPYKHWKGKILQFYKHLKKTVDIYLKSIVPLDNHPLMRDSSIHISLTDPILFLWLNQKDTDNNSRLTPRVIKQILASRTKTYNDDIKLFVTWYWIFIQDKVINKVRVRESKNVDLPTVQNNIERNDKKIFNKNLILKIFQESVTGKALPNPKRRKKVTGPQKNINDFKKSLKEMRKNWKKFDAMANYELKRIKKEVKQNEYYIYKKPYDKLTVFTRYSKKILGVTIRPPIPWSLVKPSGNK